MSDLKQIHAQSIKSGLASDPFFTAGLIAFCALETSGSLSYAHHLFSQTPNPTSFACNSPTQIAARTAMRSSSTVA
ncbi:hypothetical protein QJS10_CPA10g00458 [Acorus calamus]|uniref:Uncharacterized protein n=1 Tax=Acorus calamus TaxID=4465 RepID=A0AAV9E0C3_ACOCL|nr:hypothetical protein QJS10_CPA10g00458 [Acorus calamus]